MSKPARVVAHTTLEVSPKAACTLSACGMHLWRRARFGHPATCAHGIPASKANELSALLHAGAASVVNALRPTAIISRLRDLRRVSRQCRAALQSLAVLQTARATYTQRPSAAKTARENSANTAPSPIVLCEAALRLTISRQKKYSLVYNFKHASQTLGKGLEGRTRAQ